jgi:transposase InsO family protein
MKERNLRAKAARRFRSTTNSDHAHPVAPNTLNREFSVTAPNQVWVGDITYLQTSEGWMYLAIFLDLFSRKIVGWALSPRLTGTVVHIAFERAVARRKPPPGLLIHTDRGTQYAADAFRKRLSDKHFRLSMSRKGNCWDNAVAESFFHTLKVEAVHREPLLTRRGLELEMFDYIEQYYNRKRKHSTIEYLSPELYERKYDTETEARVA